MKLPTVPTEAALKRCGSAYLRASTKKGTAPSRQTEAVPVNRHLNNQRARPLLTEHEPGAKDRDETYGKTTNGG